IGNTDFAESYVTDQALFLQRCDGFELLGLRHGRIDPMQLPQVDALAAEPAQAEDRLLAQVLGPSARDPLTGARPDQPALCRNNDAVVRMQRIANEPLAHLRAIGDRRIDEIDAEFRY